MSRIKVFLDTNILVSLAVQRDGVDQILPIIQMSVDGITENCASVLTYANLNYLLLKRMNRSQVEATLKKYSSIIRVLPMDERQFEAAFAIAGPDFEDKLQMACAAFSDCKYILTENIRDFYGTSVPAYTPGQFLEYIRMQQTAQK